jgi:carboxypeptidase D
LIPPLLLIKLIVFTQDAFCANLVESLYDNYLGRDEHDMRELKPDRFPYSFYIQYLNSPEVQTAIGAYQNYSKSNEAVSQAFTATGDDNREASTVEALGELLRQGITVMLYAGDADYK